MSVGMIVLIILSIIIFSISIYFLFKWFGEAEELKAHIDRQTREQIQAALKIGTQRVAIPISIQAAERGDAVTFGVGVRNIESTKEFSMATSFSAAYTPDGSDICRSGEACADYIEETWLGGFSVVDTFTLRKNEQKIIEQLIIAHPDIRGVPTPKGDYVFNVCVYDKPLGRNGLPQWECSLRQFRDDSTVFYTGKIYQVTVKVT